MVFIQVKYNKNNKNVGFPVALKNSNILVQF